MSEDHFIFVLFEPNFQKLGIFALLALILNISILRYSNKNTQVGRSVVLLGIIFIVQNSSELLGYFFYGMNKELTYKIIDVYMIATYFVFTAMLAFVCDLLHLKHSSIIKGVLISYSSFLTILHMLGFLVTGYEFNGYSLQRIPTELYFLVEVFIYFCASTGLLVPAFYYISGLNKDRSVLVALTGLVFFCIGSIVLVALMQFGIQVGASVFVPVSSSVFLLVLLSASKSDLFIHVEHEFIARYQILRFLFFHFSKRDLAHHIETIEKIYIELALKKSGGSRTDAAKILNMSRGTVIGRIKKYNIDL